MTNTEALEIVCKRCINHEMCQGTGCAPKRLYEQNLSLQRYAFEQLNLGRITGIGEKKTKKRIVYKPKFIITSKQFLRDEDITANAKNFEKKIKSGDLTAVAPNVDVQVYYEPVYEDELEGYDEL